MINSTWQAVINSTWTTDKLNPNCSEFLEFLKCRIDNILDCEQTPNTPDVKCVIPSTSISLPSTPMTMAPNPDDDVQMVEAAADRRLKPINRYNRKKCAHCGVNHPLIKCLQFRTATYEARLRTVQNARLCHNYLMSGHHTEECDEGSCHRCKVPHNSIMCKANWDTDYRANSDFKFCVCAIFFRECTELPQFGVW